MSQAMIAPMISPQRQAELWAIRKMHPSLDEYRLLADRYADAAQAMQIAIANENFAGVRSAALDLFEIADQTAFLNGGLMSAIADCQKREF